MQISARLEGTALPAVDVVAGTIGETISDRCRVSVEVAAVDPVQFGSSVGSEVTLTVGGEELRRWTLRLSQVRYLGDHEGSYRYRLALLDLAARQELTRNTRKFRNLSARDIIEKVLAECRVAHRWQTTRDTAVRKFAVQYHESNLAFVERLLAFEGIYYRFDESGVMVLEDASEAAAFVRDEPFELIEAAGGMDRAELGIHVLRKVANLCVGKVCLADYNWKQPAVLLRHTAAAARDADLEIYEYPAGFRKPEQGDPLALRRLESERVRSELVEGRSSVIGFAPATSFEFGSAAGDMFAGEYLLVDVTHRFRNGDVPMLDDQVDEAVSYENEFSAMPRPKAYRPPHRRARPRVRGSHTGMVRGPAGEEIHTDKYGRFRVQMHWDREAVSTDEDSRWVRKAQECSTSVALARVGWEMYLSYLDGDPDRPVGLGRAINGVMGPEYGLPEHMNRMTIKTPSSPATGGFNEICIEDSAESQYIAMRAEKDYDNLVKRNRTEQIGNDETHTVGTDFARQVKGSQTTSIGGSSTSTIGNQSKSLVEGSRTKTVGGNETVNVSGGSGWAIAGLDLEIVGGLRLTIAGSLSVPDIGALLKSTAMTMASRVSPGAVSLYGKAQTAMSMGQQAMSTAEALSTSEGREQMVTGWLEGEGVQMGEDALRAGWGGWKEGGWQGAWDAASGSVSGDLSGMIPSRPDFQGTLDGLKSDFNNLVPSQDALGSALKDGASTLTGGLSDSLAAGDYKLALDQAIDMFCVGGIIRTSSTVILKMVGGAYITVAIGEISWLAGKGYTETVGGAKISMSLKEMTTSVTGAHTLTVGGLASRESKADMSIAAPTSTITVAGNATYKSDDAIEVSGGTITINASGALNIKAGGGEIAMTPGSIALKGDVNLEGSGEVHFSGQLDIT
ncbi:MAG: type VI secretion system tip protein VgrG [Deltaproteobacteria bacterium]|nr:type VI secretion system tip protein VgrG [Deltaproteobacteria bacterium]MBW2533390.1 type VI secretion system tip protein VgrG [Deltaproteobacteria bacterium]